jgi:hypothetical protein
MHLISHIVVQPNEFATIVFRLCRDMKKKTHTNDDNNCYHFNDNIIKIYAFFYYCVMHKWTIKILTLLVGENVTAFCA